MRKVILGVLLGTLAVALALGFAVWRFATPSAEELLASVDGVEAGETLEIIYPFDGAVFPPEIVAPTIRWNDPTRQASRWLVAIRFDGGDRVTAWADEASWSPSEEIWATIKSQSRRQPAQLIVLGVHDGWRSRGVSAGKVSFSTSDDEVGAPIFYREVNLPFAEAVKDPSRIRWRFGAVASTEQPPIVLEKLPVCGNCHSFSADAEVLGMDVDYGSDKGSYAILPVETEMPLSPDRIITWNDYQPDGRQLTRGLLSQVSPDGRFVASTVKDASVFLPVEDLTFSQLFFPIKGIVGIYCRETGKFQALPGADDPKFVQSNPTWSPDGKWIIFARAEARDLPRQSGERPVFQSIEDCQELLQSGKPFAFDLYRVPFNDGRGGKAEPLAGASHNGMSNYFPKFSPDGRWIVFCRAKSFMLLQPDSELYIVPAAGGESRRLQCNAGRMNSWHSWSPNGKWIVFSSKAFTPYTQLFLAHIDERGEAAPAVLLERFTSPDRAANIPEFVNAGPEAIHRIREQFLNDYSYSGMALVNLNAGDLKRAEDACRQALVINPKNPRALGYLGAILIAQQKLDQAEQCLRESVRVDPKSSHVQHRLGLLLAGTDRQEEAIAHLKEAVKLAPEEWEAQGDLGRELLKLGKCAEAETYLAEAIRRRPEDVELLYTLGQSQHLQGKEAAALAAYSSAAKRNGNFVPALMGVAVLSAEAADPKLRSGETAVQFAQRACELTAFEKADALGVLAAAFAQAGRRAEAVAAAQRALAIARQSGDAKVADEIGRRLESYQALPDR